MNNLPVKYFSYFPAIESVPCVSLAMLGTVKNGSGGLLMKDEKILFYIIRGGKALVVLSGKVLRIAANKGNTAGRRKR